MGLRILFKLKYICYPSQVADHRARKDYGCNELLSASLAMFIFKAQSRNAVNNDRRHSGEFKSNFQKLFNADLPHLDAVQDLFKVLPPAELVVDLIASTKTSNGLKVKSRLDSVVYAKGIKVSDEELAKVNMIKDDFHGEWNYIIKPKT